MKILKKILSAVLASAMVVGMSIGAFAYDRTYEEKSSYSSISSYEQAYLEQQKQRFEQMSLEELNAYIDSSKEASTTLSYRSLRRGDKGAIVIATKLELKAAWLAAAQIAKLKGYPCAAKLVECSVIDKDYSEDEDCSKHLFTNKIKKNKDFKKYLDKVKKDSSYDTLRFRKENSSDLFYSLNKVDPYYNSRKDYVEITDKFNFDYYKEYESIFTSTVNNWAWLCQNTDILNSIDVSISFDL